MPQLLNGAFTILLEAPNPAIVLELIEPERITSFFAPPTVWITLLQHPDFARRDLSSLRKRLLRRLDHAGAGAAGAARSGCPARGPSTATARREIAPLATVLRPEEHEARPGSVGRAGAERGDPRGRCRDARRGAGRARRGRAPLAAIAARLLGHAGGDGARLRGRLVPQRRRGDRSTRRAISPSSTAPRT